MNKQEKRFSYRAFAAVGMAFSAVGLPISGYMNHLRQFESMNVDRHAWMSAHNCLGALFVLFAVWHLTLNWRPMMKHLKGAIAGVPAFSREAIAAGAIVAIALFLFVGHALHMPG